MRMVRRAALCVAAILAATAGSAWATTPISGFKEEVVASGLDLALSMDWTPDGRMVFVEKPGVVKVLNTDGTIKQVLDISAHVNAHTDRGLTGVAVDAAYASNHYVYLLYTYDAQDRDNAQPTASRLTRITLGTDNKVANVNTIPETTILGGYAIPGACPAGNQYNCIPADGVSHVAGTVRSAPDGTLFVGTGDAMFNAQNSPDPLRPLDQTSMAGKILHIDRTGKGLEGHPYCPADSTLTHACTRIYAMGLRNPFRFSLRSSGGLWAGDVGESLFEELDQVGEGGSYGWPCYEGTVRNQARESDPRCQNAYAAGRETLPIYSYARGPFGSAIIAGPEVRSSRYPADWQGSVFVGDIVTGELKRLEIGADGSVTERPFGTGWLGAELQLGPDGLLYTAEFYTIKRFVPVEGNRPPEARATVAPSAGLVPFDAYFDGSESSDPDGDPLTYAWTFGDGISSTEMSPTHTYLTNGNYTARLTVSDPEGASSSVDVPVVVGTTPPAVAFTAPAAGFQYSDGVPVDMAVNATDAEDGTLPDASISWEVILQHSHHKHFLGTFTGPTARFTPLVSHDADSFYIAKVTATDSAGVSTTATRQLDPKTVRLELATDPALGIELFYDGAPHAAPFVKQSAVGFETTIVAPQTAPGPGGKTLVFSGWSDGGGATHQIKVPDGDIRLVARYTEDNVPPETTITGGPDESPNQSHTPRFSFTADEPASRFECRVDSAPWTTCASPWNTPYQKPGSHTLYVRAYDLAGNVDPTPDKKGFAVVPGEQL